MKNSVTFLCIFILWPMLSLASESIDGLLSDFGEKSDLSLQTKKESYGHSIVYTRQDIDRLQIRSLKELIDYLPMFRYNEDNKGQGNPFYSPYQPSKTPLFRVYINERELFSPYSGNSLELFSQMNIGYIDHIEIYIGISSYSFGIEGSMAVIRMYTKDPDRENTTLVGMSGASYGIKEVYGYATEAFEDFSYLVHGSVRDINSKTLYNEGHALSRDQESGNIFAEFKKDNSRFEVQALKGRMDNFIGDSWGIKPLKNDTAYDYFYTGWYYTSEDKSFKASLNFVHSTTDHDESASDFLGLIPNTYYVPYQKYEMQMTEQMSDLHLSKVWKDDKDSFLLGFRGRYKHFTIDKLLYDDVEPSISQDYNSEFISSLYTEATHLFNDSHMLVAGLKYENYQRNGNIDSDNIVGGRVGYIYNNEAWSLKTFYNWGEFSVNPYIIASNANNSLVTWKLEPEKSKTISTELTYRQDQSTTSLFLAHMEYDNSLYFDGTSYKNSNEPVIYDIAILKNSYTFDSLSRLDTNVWFTAATIDSSALDPHYNNAGGYVTLFNTIDKWSLANSVLFYALDYDNAPGYNLNTAITYRWNRNLSLFLKGNNLLGKALPTDYYRINFMTSTVTTLRKADVYDRTILLGWEYQF